MKQFVQSKVNCSVVVSKTNFGVVVSKVFAEISSKLPTFVINYVYYLLEDGEHYYLKEDGVGKYLIG